MDADEQDICNYLKQWPKQFISGREIAKRAGGKRRAKDEPTWATDPLLRMVEKQIIEADRGGHFRLIQQEKKPPPKKWVSPQIKKLLEESGKKFEGVIDVDTPDDSPS